MASTSTALRDAFKAAQCIVKVLVCFFDEPGLYSSPKRCQPVTTLGRWATIRTTATSNSKVELVRLAESKPSCHPSPGSGNPQQ